MPRPGKAREGGPAGRAAAARGGGTTHDLLAEIETNDSYRARLIDILIAEIDHNGEARDRLWRALRASRSMLEAADAVRNAVESLRWLPRFEDPAETQAPERALRDDPDDPPADPPPPPARNRGPERRQRTG